MSLKRILVHIDDSEQSPGRVAAALALAQKHDAHLSAAAVELYPVIPTYAMAHMPAEVHSSLAEEQRARVVAASEAFSEAAEAADWTARTDVKTARGDVARVLAHFGRTADMIVVSQGVEDSDTEELPDNLILESGTPVLVLPVMGETNAKTGTKALVAWTDSRESARAVRDAMPILEEATSVEVLCIADESETVELGEIARYLAAHGITAEVNKQPSGTVPVEATILNRVADGGFDMIVCGGYGHSRLRETVLGGVTRSLLRSSTVPVMMSH